MTEACEYGAIVTVINAVLVGVVSSFLVAVVVEWVRKPRLRISILPPLKAVLMSGEGVVLEPYVALRVRVSNEPLPFVFQWMQRQSARDCRATLQFLQEDETLFIDRLMAGRWAASTQPIALHGTISPGGQTIEIQDVDRLSADSRIHIPAGESEILDVAVRFPAATDSFGWTNESYRHGGRHPDFRLPSGRYKVEIVVRSEGVKKRERLRIENAYTINEFRLASQSSQA